MFFPSKHIFAGTATGAPLSWHACPDHYAGFSCLNMPGSVTIWALATCPCCHVVLTWIHHGLSWPSGEVGLWVCCDMPGFFHQGDGGSFCCNMPEVHHGTSCISWLIWSVATHPDPDAIHPVIIHGVLFMTRPNTLRLGVLTDMGTEA